MLKILDVAWNDIKVEFSHRSTLIFFLVLPLVFTAVIGAGMRSMYEPSDEGEDDRYVLLVADQDQGALSDQLIALLESSEVIRPVERDLAEAQQLFEENNIPALLVIPDGFEETLLAGDEVDLELRKSMDDDRVFAVEQEVAAAVSRVGGMVAAAQFSVAQAEQIEPFASEDARQAYYDQALDLAREQLAEPGAEVSVVYPPQTEEPAVFGTSFDQSSAGQLVTWVLITLVGAAEGLVNERLGGTLRRLVITPTRKAALLAGKVVGRLAMGIVQMILLVLFGMYVFDVAWGHSLAGLAVMLLSFGLAAVAFGVMLSTFAKTRKQAEGLTIFFSMVLAALGGAWWPMEVTPPAFQMVVKALPSTWAMMGFNDIVLRGLGVVDVLPEAGVLLGFALVFFVVGIWRFRYE